MDADEAAVGEIGSNDAVEEDAGLEFGDTGGFEVDLEVAVVVEVVGFDDVLGEEAGGEAAALEEVVDVGGGGGEAEEEEEMEEEEGHGRLLWEGERFKGKVGEREDFKGGFIMA